MKKLLLILCIAICGLSLNAQGFEPAIKASYEQGVDSYKNISFGGQFIGSYRINNQVKVGAGVGLSYVNLLYEDAGFVIIGNHVYVQDKYKEDAVSIPVFANAKFNFIDNSISPYFDIDLGYNIFVPCSDYAKNNKLGFFFAPKIGVDFSVGKGQFFFEAGYKYQMRKCDLWLDTNGNYSQVTLGIGYQF